MCRLASAIFVLARTATFHANSPKLFQANGMRTPDIRVCGDFAQDRTSARSAGSQLFGFNILRESVNAIARPFREPKICLISVKEVANILRCSKAHVHNAIHGKVQGLPKLTDLTWGAGN